MNIATLKRPLFGLSILTSIVIILFLKTNPSVFGATPGSFEYIRKGEIFLGKDKYLDAINYFEKAYRASPENKIIKSDLVFAYSKYSRDLAKSKKFDKAIEYLAKSYDIMKNSNTAQNLALMYSKKAMAEAEKGDWYKTVADFTNGRFAAADFSLASSSLAVWLFNEGVSAYRSRRDDIAILCLKESNLARENARTLELLGDIYYNKTDLKKAAFYWDKADALDPENAALAAKLKKLARETELAKMQEKADLPHFDLRYERGLLGDPALTREVLEKAYLEVGTDLSYFPSKKTVVFLYSEDDFRSIFNMPTEVRAFYDGNIRLPFPGKVIDKNEFAHYIFHEYAHAVVSAKTNNNCPVWLNEGIAVWEEYKREKYNIIGLLPQIDDNARLSIHSLEEAFEKDKQGKDMRVYYFLAYTAVSYIVDNWGLEGVRDILKRVASGQHVINAIDDEFLLPEKEFEKRWTYYVRKIA